MEYLLLAILVSSLFPISFRIFENFKFDSKATIILNYLFGSIFMLMIFLLSFKGSINFFPFLSAFLLGFPTGIIFYLCLILYQQNISKNGLSLSALFMKIALIIPIILSIIIFLERPTTYQYIGILLALIAIMILNGGFKQIKGVTKGLLLLFLLSGIGDFINKIYEECFDMTYQQIFISSTFLTACILGYFIDKKQVKGKFNKINIIAGIFIGICNSLSTFFIIKTFTVMYASTAMVLLNISIILFISIVGILFFKERLKRNEFYAFIISVISIILISL